MLNDLPKDKNIVPIRQAAEILGVSIDTVRRWDKEGILHAERPNGKDRYFSIEELEKVKLSHPLTISDVAHRLNMSQSTLRRLEKKGLISPERDVNGERMYTQKTLEDFLNSSYFLRKQDVQEKILEPLKDLDPQQVEQKIPEKIIQPVSPENKESVVEKELKDIAISNNRLMMLLGNNLLKNNRKVNGVFGVAKFVVSAGILLTGLSMIVIASLVFLFLRYPKAMGAFFATGPSAPQFVARQGEGLHVLGAETGPVPGIGQNIATTFLRPFAGISLQIVKVIKPQTYTQVQPQVFPPSTNTVMQVTNQGDVVSSGNIILPSGSTLKIEDKNVVSNLNADFVRGKTPGQDEGNLAVLGPGGTIDGLQISAANIESNSITTNLLSSNAVTTVNVSNGAITQEKVATGAITSAEILDGTILNADISDTAGITDNKLAQITTSGKVAGSAVALSSGGGLVDSSGLSLLRTCSSSQTLIWDGSSWTCGTSSSGTISGVTAGNGLTGGGTTGTVNLAVLIPASGTSANTSSNSGFEVGASGVSLLRGCSDTQVLVWNNAGGVWQCANQTGGGGGGIATLQEGGSNVVTSATTLNTNSNDFNVTNSGAGTGLLAIDYANSKIVRNNQNETIVGNYTFGSATPLAFSSTSPSISIGNTGTLTITDGTNTLMSLVDNGTTGNLTVTGTISGSNLSGTNTGDQTTVSGNAGTATALQNARLINGVSFNGSADITVTAAAGTVTGNTLNSGVTASSLTSVGSLVNGTVVGTDTFGNHTITDSGALTIASGGAGDVAFNPASGTLTSNATAVNFGSAVLTVSSCVGCGGGSSGPNFLRLTSGALSPVNDTLDFLVGSQATSSAKFAVLNVNSGTPVASVSAGNNGATYVTADGTLSTTNNQGLVLGTSTTGGISIGTDATARSLTLGNVTGASGLSLLSGSGGISVTGNITQASTGTFTTGTGSVFLNGDTTIASGKLFTIAGGSGNPTATNGTIWYDTSANEFKVVENGTVKILCNKTDLGCGSGGAGIATVKEGGSTIVTSATAANFNASDFAITDEGGGTAGVAVDYANSKIVRSTQAETITGGWAFTTSPTIFSSAIDANGGITTSTANQQLALSANGLGNVLVNPNAGGSAALVVNDLGNGPLFTASASGVTKFTVSNTGSLTAATSSTINGISINAGTITGATIAAGSNTISGLTAGSLTAGDFSSVINTGTYNINVSGTAGSASSATTATTATNANNVATTAVSNNATYYPLFVGSNSNSNQPVDLGTGLTFNPNTNTLSTTTFSGALSGNATTATTLQNARLINGVSFDGSGDITVTAAAGTLTGNTLNSGVTTSSLTSVGSLVNGTVVGTDTFGSHSIADSGALVINSNGSSTLTLQSTGTGDIQFFSGSNKITNAGALTIAGALSSSNFSGTSSGTNTGDQTTVSGNAGTATALQNARLINGVSFNGTADITVTADANTLTNTTLHSTVVNSSLTSVGTLTGLTVSGAINANTGIITSTANQQLTLSANGLGNVLVNPNAGGSAALVVNDLGTGPLFTASSSGTPKFTVANNGDILATGALTGATISAGSNTISGLTAGNLTAGDFSTKINSGTYSIDISGNANTATSATSATSATFATTATNANNVATTQVSNNATYYPLFVGSSSNGNQAASLGTGLSFNPSTSALTATTFIGILSGNASTATVLQNARNINGVSFNGSADITVTAAAGTLTGNTLNSGVTTSSLTSVGSLVNGTVVGTDTFNSHTIADSGALTISSAAGGDIALNPAGNLTSNATTINFGSANLTVASCSGCSGPAANNFFRLSSGALSPVNDTLDFLVGGNASSSSKFAVLNVGNGTPIASVSAGTNGATYIAANGTLATTNMQTLVLGTATTGPINFYGTSNKLDSSGNLTLAGIISANTAGTINGLSINGSNQTLTGHNIADSGALTINSNGSSILTLQSTGTGDIQFFSGSNKITSGGALTIAGALSSSNFSGSSSGTNTGDQTTVTGNAGTATALQNARNINGVSFNGTADITVTAAAGTLTGNTLNSGVTASSLTSVGSLVNGTVVGTDTFGNHTITDSGELTISTGANGNLLLTPSGIGNTTISSDAGGNAGLIANDIGAGDIFTASASGATKFIIANNGNVSIATTSALARLQVGGGNILLDNNREIDFLDTDGTTPRTILSFNNSGNTFLRAGSATGRLDLRTQNNVTSLALDSSGKIGIGPGNLSPLASLDIRSFSGTLAVASVSGRTSFAGLVVDNSGVGDLLTASTSGLTRFTIQNTGNILATGTLTGLTGLTVNSGSVSLPAASLSTGALTGTLFVAGATSGTTTQNISTGNTLTFTAGTDITTTGAAGAITFADSSTLSSVAGRGASTGTTLALNGGLTSSSTSPLSLSGASPTITSSNGDLTLDLTKSATNTLILVNSTGGQTADLNLSDGALKLNNTTRISNAGVGTFAGGTGVTGSNATYFQLDNGTGFYRLYTDLTIQKDFAISDDSGVSKIYVAGNGGGFGVPTDAVGIGHGFTSPKAALHVSGGNSSGNAALIVDQIGASTNDILTASASGQTKFTINNNGNLVATGTLTGLTGLTLSSGTLALGSNTISGTPTWSSNQAITLSTASQPNITSVGSLVNGTVIGTDTFGSHTLTDSGALAINSASGSNLTLDSVGGTSSLNLGNANATTINIGNHGASGNSVIFDKGATGTFTLKSNGSALDCSGFTNSGKLSTDSSGNIICANDISGGGGSVGVFEELSGTVSPLNSTEDFLIGGQASTAAKFAIENVNSGTPVASVSAINNGGAYLTADGILATTAKQGLTLGAITTGGISIGTDATDRSITLGNTTGVNALTLTAGTGNINFYSSSNNITSAGALTLASTITANTTGTINGLNINSGNITGVTGLTLASGTLALGSNTISGTPTWSNNQSITLQTASQPNITSVGTLTSLGVTGAITSGALTVTSTSTTALTVGRQGTTSPALQVDSSTNGTSVTGFKIIAGAAGGGISLSEVGGNTDENLTLDAKGAGTLTLNGTATGGITLSRATTVSGTLGANGALIADNTGGAGGSNGVSEFSITNTTSGKFPKILINGPTDNTGGEALEFYGGSVTKGGISYVNNATNTSNELDISNRLAGAFISLQTSNGALTEGLRIDQSGKVGIGTVANGYGNGQLVVNQTNNSGLGDIFSASASGIPKFTISNTGSASLSGNLTLDAAATIATTKNQTLTIGGSTTGGIVLGTSTNGLLFSSLTGPTYAGTARPAKTITLSPEYAGASLTADGSVTTNGAMTSDNTLNAGSIGWKNYYQWTSTQGTLQDYTIAVRVALPQDFDSWQTGSCGGSSCAMEIAYQTGVSGTTDNTVSVQVNNAESTPGTVLCTISASSSTTWTTFGCTSTDLATSPTWNTAGQTAIIRIKLAADSTASALARIGDITLRYYAKF